MRLAVSVIVFAMNEFSPPGAWAGLDPYGNIVIDLSAP
jgi:hypothetical protein